MVAEGFIMARPRSEAKYNAILDAAAQLIAESGLGAATAQIAQRAGVPHGSVFTYFSTKGELFNTLYLALKNELTKTVLAEMPTGGDTRAQMQHLWVVWTGWGVANPAKRRALAQLGVSEVVSDRSRKAAYEEAEAILALVHRASVGGVLAQTPDYAAALIEAMASTTMDFMARSTVSADAICDAGFEALWQTLS